MKRSFAELVGLKANGLFCSMQIALHLSSSSLSLRKFEGFDIEKIYLSRDVSGERKCKYLIEKRNKIPCQPEVIINEKKLSDKNNGQQMLKYRPKQKAALTSAPQTL